MGIGNSRKHNTDVQDSRKGITFMLPIHEWDLLNLDQNSALSQTFSVRDDFEDEYKDEDVIVAGEFFAINDCGEHKVVRHCTISEDNNVDNFRFCELKDTENCVCGCYMLSEDENDTKAINLAQYNRLESPQRCRKREEALENQLQCCLKRGEKSSGEYLNDATRLATECGYETEDELLKYFDMHQNPVQVVNNCRTDKFKKSKFHPKTNKMNSHSIQDIKNAKIPQKIRQTVVGIRPCCPKDYIHCDEDFFKGKKNSNEIFNKPFDFICESQQSFDSGLVSSRENMEECIYNNGKFDISMVKAVGGEVNWSEKCTQSFNKKLNKISSFVSDISIESGKGSSNSCSGSFGSDGNITYSSDDFSIHDSTEHYSVSSLLTKSRLLSSSCPDFHSNPACRFPGLISSSTNIRDRLEKVNQSFGSDFSIDENNLTQSWYNLDGFGRNSPNSFSTIEQLERLNTQNNLGDSTSCSYVDFTKLSHCPFDLNDAGMQGSYIQRTEASSMREDNIYPSFQKDCIPANMKVNAVPWWYNSMFNQREEGQSPVFISVLQDKKSESVSTTSFQNGEKSHVSTASDRKCFSKISFRDSFQFNLERINSGKLKCRCRRRSLVGREPTSDSESDSSSNKQCCPSDLDLNSKNTG